MGEQIEAFLGWTWPTKAKYTFVIAEGSTGHGLHRQLTVKGHTCDVIGP